MSAELDNPHSVSKAREKKRKQREDTSGLKKRKRSKDQDSSLASPTKKYRSKHSRDDRRAKCDAPQLLDPTTASPFFHQTSSLYLPLSPICQRSPLQGLCAEHISPLILTYYAPLNGVVLCYSNAKLSTVPPRYGEEEEEPPVLARSIDEYAVSYVWLTADFLLFRPQRGCVIEGWINLQNEGVIGLVCYNYFNASIERKRLPKDWKWVPAGGHRPRIQKLKRPVDVSDESMLDGENEHEEGAEDEASYINGFEEAEGHFVDGSRKKVEGIFRFRVKDMDTSRSTDREKGFLSIEGTTLSDNEEKQLRQDEFLRSQAKLPRRPGTIRDLEFAMTGALVNGDLDHSADVDSTPRTKHRLAY